MQKAIVTAVHDPDQHQYHSASARKIAEEPHVMKAGTPPYHAWDVSWPATEGRIERNRPICWFSTRHCTLLMRATASHAVLRKLVSTFGR